MSRTGGTRLTPSRVVVVAALASTLILFALGRIGGLDPVKEAAGVGVVQGGPLARDALYSSVVPGKHSQFTDGQIRLLLRGAEAATITGVTSNGGEDTFELIGAMVSGPDRRWGSTQYRPGWPPAATFGPNLVDAEGAVVRPASESDGMGYELLLGYQLKQTESFGDPRVSVTIEYTVGSTDYAYTEQSSLTMCPGSGKSRTCLREWDRQSAQMERDAT